MARAAGVAPNQEARNRACLARYLARCLEELGIDYRQAAREIGIAPRRIRHLNKSAPQLRVLHPLGAYIQAKTRELVRN